MRSLFKHNKKEEFEEGVQEELSLETEYVEDMDGEYYEADGEYSDDGYYEDAEGVEADDADGEYYEAEDVGDVESEDADGEYYEAEDADGEYYEAEDVGDVESEDTDGEYYEVEDVEAEDADGEYYEVEDVDAEDADGEYYEAEDAEDVEADDADGEYYEVEDAEIEVEDASEAADEAEIVGALEDAASDDGFGEHYYGEEETDESEDDYYGIEEIGGDDLEFYTEFAVAGKAGKGAKAAAQRKVVAGEVSGAEYGDAEYSDEEYADTGYAGADSEGQIGDSDDGDDEEVGGFLGWIMGMSTMDMVMMGTAVCIVLLALITGVVFMRSRSDAQLTAAFANVGTQLDGIEVVGDKGLMAVADATIAKQEALKLMEEEGQPQQKPDYQEVSYNKTVNVVLKTISVQKDLKIKFVNKSSEKLIANVPFQVTITTPDNKTENWSDDDMDGIIYKKGITPGTYKISVNALSGEKYADYTLPLGEETAEVKKDIAYQKIDVSDEVKTEAEINVAQEEQKKQEPAVESSLTDTVEWVPSTAVTSNYIEVSKSAIADPMSASIKGSFLRTAGEVKLNETSVELAVGDKLELKAKHSLDNVSSMGWSSSDSSVATVGADGVVRAVAPGTATITCTVTVVEVSEENEEDDEEAGEEVNYTAQCVVTVPGDEEQTDGKVTVSPTSLALSAGKEGTAQVSVSGFASGQELEYNVSSSDIGVATATVNKSGKISVTAVSSGKATITVTVNYSEEPLSKAPSAELAVTVEEEGEFNLSQTTATLRIGETVDITASLGGSTEATFTAKSSDTKVATASVNGKTVTITGVKAGTARVTVTASNGDSGTCVVTVQENPTGDDTTLLKDKEGNQLFVQEDDGTYREAVTSDYYKDGVKFFKRGATKYTGWQTIDGKVYFFDKNGNKVTGEQVIQGAKYNFASDGSLVTGSGTMGIDVSKHNATIDWNAVKNSGVSYVIIRCGYRGYTHGTLVIDPKFQENIKGATAAGLKVGVYFFSQAVDEVEAVQEASFVLDVVRGYKISYPIFLDVEYSGASGNSGRADGLSKSARTAVCKAFCATIQSGGYTAGVYANKNWLETKLDPGQLGSYKIWLAQYAATPTYGGRYDMWQYKSTGKVSGITGNVDMNISYLGY